MAADVDVRFRLAAPADRSRCGSPRVETEVATERTHRHRGGRLPGRRRTSRSRPRARSRYVLERGGDRSDVGTSRRLGAPDRRRPARRSARRRAPGDALYLGFREPLDRLMLQVYVDCSRAPRPGRRPRRPAAGCGRCRRPADARAARRRRALGARGGPARQHGRLQPRHRRRRAAAARRRRRRPRSPARSALAALPGDRAPALGRRRPRLPGSRREIHGDHGRAGRRAGAGLPRASRRARRCSARATARRASASRLRHAAGAARCAATSACRCATRSTGVWEDWERRESFAESGERDRHYVLDVGVGRGRSSARRSGPSSGGWEQHGAIPPTGAALRITGYRHGGGAAGNVAADALRVLRTAIPGVAHVTNPRHALGGVDAETLDNARERAALEFRARYRAVTARRLRVPRRRGVRRRSRGRAASPPRSPATPSRVHILPRVEPAGPAHDRGPAAARRGARRGRARRSSTRAARSARASTCCPSSCAASPSSSTSSRRRARTSSAIEQDLLYALNVYLNPLVGGSQHGLGDGWEFGRALNAGRALRPRARGARSRVRHSSCASTRPTSTTGVPSRARRPAPTSSSRPAEVVVSGRHQVQVEQRQL